jgi:hypothetical protein
VGHRGIGRCPSERQTPDRSTPPVTSPGGLQDFQVNQDVCDINAPFSLDGKVGVAKFSGGLTAIYVADGMFRAHYTGTYVITLTNGPGEARPPT